MKIHPPSPTPTLPSDSCAKARTSGETPRASFPNLRAVSERFSSGNEELGEKEWIVTITQMNHDIPLWEIDGLYHWYMTGRVVVFMGWITHMVNVYRKLMGKSPCYEWENSLYVDWAMFNSKLWQSLPEGKIRASTCEQCSKSLSHPMILFVF